MLKRKIKLEKVILKHSRRFILHLKNSYHTCSIRCGFQHLDTPCIVLPLYWQILLKDKFSWTGVNLPILCIPAEDRPVCNDLNVPVAHSAHL